VEHHCRRVERQGKHTTDGNNSVQLGACQCYLEGPSDPVGTELDDELLKCALEPRKRLCHINASLNNSSISFSVHCLVGRACKNMRTSWKFILTSCSDHFTKNAAHTYRWNCEKPFSSACDTSALPMQTCYPTYQIRIPHSYDTPNAQLSHQQAVHPTEAELHILNTFALQMLGQTGINPCS
jgi:hypothetical protein